MKSMKRITFTCETVTPMFLTGADSRTPELRSPSIKGVMRFWWRAMNGHLSLRELKEKESRIFGGTGNFQQRSSFTVRVIPQSVSIGNYRLVPHKKFDSQAFSPGSLFDVTFTIEPTSDNHEEISLEKLKALFFITCYLGGFGKRVRRGMGSVNIIAIDNDIKKIPAKIDLNFILELLQNFSSHYKIQNNKIVFSYPGISPLFGYITEIQIGKANPNYTNILLKISQATSTLKSIHSFAYAPSMGFAEKGNRYASPVISSVLKDSFKPIVTTLNIAPPNRGEKSSLTVQDDFKAMIL